MTDEWVYESEDHDAFLQACNTVVERLGQVIGRLTQDSAPLPIVVAEDANQRNVAAAKESKEELAWALTVALALVAAYGGEVEDVQRVLDRELERLSLSIEKPAWMIQLPDGQYVSPAKSQNLPPDPDSTHVWVKHPQLGLISIPRELI